MATPTTTEEGSQAATTETDVSSEASSNVEAHAEVKNMKKLLTETKVEGGKSAWATTLETFGMHQGEKKKGDVLCDDLDDAMKALSELVQDKGWEFATTPFTEFNASKEDLLKAFVHWSRKSDDEATSYNPSKAFRRLEAYVEWMDKNCQGMNLKGATMKEIAEAWKMKLTRDKEGRLVWWIDFESVDLKHIKTQVPQDDTLRYYIWLCHLVLFDKGCQENGLVFVWAVGHKGMLETMTCVSMDLGTKLDRITIGILPIKMEACIMFNNPTWIRFFMGLATPFMSKKMRKRMIVIPNKKDPQEHFDEVIGREHIPTGLSGLQGTIEKDLVLQALERNVVTDEVET